MPYQKELEFARTLARSAGAIVRNNFGKALRLTKTHAAAQQEAVTETDRASQRHIVSAIREAFPTDGVVGEEDDLGSGITVDVNDAMGRNWVIDPIDGTNNFIAGLGAFAVCIGLLDRGMPVVGAVYDVTRDTLYSAATGAGVWVNQSRLTPRDRAPDETAVIMLTANVLDRTGRCPEWAIKLIHQTDWKVRILGSAAIESALVGAGVATSAVTVNGKIWDCVAPSAIVLESGGVVTDLSGRPVFPFDLTGYKGAKVPFLAGSPSGHAAFLKLILENP